MEHQGHILRYLRLLKLASSKQSRRKRKRGFRDLRWGDVCSEGCQERKTRPTLILLIGQKQIGMRAIRLTQPDFFVAQLIGAQNE